MLIINFFIAVIVSNCDSTGNSRLDKGKKIPLFYLNPEKIIKINVYLF